MTTSTIIAMLVGLVIPGITAAVTKLRAPKWLKALIALLLSTATGVLTGLIGTSVSGLSGWEHVATNILLAFVAAAAADHALWVPTGASAMVARITARFGFGSDTE